MKTTIITCAFFSLMSLATYAQQDTLPALPELPEVNQNVDEIDKEIEVIVKSDSGKVDTTKIKIGTAKVLIIKDGKTTEISEDGLSSETEVVADSAMLAEKEKKNSKKSRVDFFEGVELGSAGYTTPAGKFSLPPHLAHMELNYARSYRLNVNFLETGFNIGTPKIRLVTGMGLAFTSYALDNQTKLIKSNGMLDYTIDTVHSYRKNKLNVQYLNVPLLLCFTTKNKEKGSVRLAIGPEVGLRIGTNQKQVFFENGDKMKPKNKSDFYLSPFLANATARVSFGKLTFFGTYSLNSIFVAGKGPGLNAYSVGIRIS